MFAGTPKWQPIQAGPFFLAPTFLGGALPVFFDIVFSYVGPVALLAQGPVGALVLLVGLRPPRTLRHLGPLCQPSACSGPIGPLARGGGAVDFLFRPWRHFEHPSHTLSIFLLMYMRWVMNTWESRPIASVWLSFTL